MSKASFNNLPYDIYLKIANAAIEDFVDDSLPFLPFRLICPGFTPIISQAITDKWAHSNPTFHILASTQADRLERFLRMYKWPTTMCEITHLTFTGDEITRRFNRFRGSLRPIKPKHRFHQCISALITCRKTLEVLHLRDAVQRQDQDCIPFDNWDSKELNMGFPALRSLTLTLWHLPLLPALLVNSPQLVSLTFVDTGFDFRYEIYHKRYPELEKLLNSGNPLTHHTIQNVAIEAGYGTDFRRLLTLLNLGAITVRHATMTVQRANPASSDLLYWRGLLPVLHDSRFFKCCTTIRFPCPEAEIGTEVLSSMNAGFRSRLRWTDCEIPRTLYKR